MGTSMSIEAGTVTRECCHSETVCARVALVVVGMVLGVLLTNTSMILTILDLVPNSSGTNQQLSEPVPVAATLGSDAVRNSVPERRTTTNCPPPPPAPACPAPACPAPAPAPLCPSQGQVDSKGRLPFLCDPFEHMFIINLVGDAGKARREHAMKELTKAGLVGKVQFFPAVDAKTDVELGKETNQVCPCNSQFALALSHRRIYEKILEERWPCATIFEDDFSLADNFFERFRKATVDLPPFDTLQLGHCLSGAKPGPPGDQKSIPKIKYGWPGACLHATVVSMQGAYLLKAANTPVHVPADGAMAREHQPAGLRGQLDSAPGTLQGSYWYTDPQLSWQGGDQLDGGA